MGEGRPAERDDQDPGDRRGPDAITAVIGAGISVNVTLIFSLDRYREVIDAYLAGLEQAKGAGIDLSTIHSVASFFVSRVDTEIDKRLTAIGTDEALALKSKAGVANARLAYELYEQVFGGERATPSSRPARTASGRCGRRRASRTRRSTPLRHRARRPGVVNTMPEKTLEATFDHGEIVGDTVTGAYADAGAVLDSLARVGVDYDDVTAVLEREGVEKFIAWHELLDTVHRAWRRHDELPHLRQRRGRRGGGPPHRPRPRRRPRRQRHHRAGRELWGPAAEAEASTRLGWTEAVAVSRPLVPEIEALRERSSRRRHAHRARRHGRLLAGSRGHHPHRAGRAHRAGLDRAWPGRAVLAHRLAESAIVISSKSGSTVETDSQRRVYEQAF